MRYVDLYAEMMSRVMCRVIGIAPIDPMDGTPNWWMFNNKSREIINSLLKEFPPPGKEQFGPEYGPYVLEL